MSQPHGMLVVNKPAGITSHDVVNRIRRIFRTKRVGHTGTLDPQATGVLVLCLGNGTRLAEYLSADRKQYLAEFTFGFETSTQDIWGEVTERFDASNLTAKAVLGQLPWLAGSISQVPPMVSAKKVDGKRLYQLARQGKTVEREPRSVSIFQFEMSDFVAGNSPTASMLISCSSGTYIRTLAYDLGRLLGVGCSMSRLERLSVGTGTGAFTLDHSHTLESVQILSDQPNSQQELHNLLLPLEQAVDNWSFVHLTTEQEVCIRHGQHLSLSELEIYSELADPIALLDSNKKLTAIARIEGKTIRPIKVMALDPEHELDDSALIIASESD